MSIIGSNRNKLSTTASVISVTPTGRVTCTPKQEVLLYYHNRRKGDFALVQQSVQPTETLQLSNEKPSSLNSYFPLMNFHFTLAEDFLVPPSFL